MISRSDLEARAQHLKERIEKGALLLWDMELKGETGDDYQRWLPEFERIVTEYRVITWDLAGMTRRNEVA